MPEKSENRKALPERAPPDEDMIRETPPITNGKARANQKRSAK